MYESNQILTNNCIILIFGCVSLCLEYVCDNIKVVTETLVVSNHRSLKYPQAFGVVICVRLPVQRRELFLVGPLGCPSAGMFEVVGGR